MSTILERHWLLTWTTYGTWLAGDERGFVANVRTDEGQTERHNEPRTPCDQNEPRLQEWMRKRLVGEPLWLALAHAAPLAGQFRETAEYRGWDLAALAILSNHVHLVVGVPGDPNPESLLRDFKAYGSRSLNLLFGKPPSSTWWTDGGSKRKLPDEEAMQAAIQYVLRQHRPLFVWAKESTGERTA